MLSNVLQQLRTSSYVPQVYDSVYAYYLAFDKLARQRKITEVNFFFCQNFSWILSEETCFYHRISYWKFSENGILLFLYRMTPLPNYERLFLTNWRNSTIRKMHLSVLKVCAFYVLYCFVAEWVNWIGLNQILFQKLIFFCLKRVKTALHRFLPLKCLLIFLTGPNTYFETPRYNVGNFQVRETFLFAFNFFQRIVSWKMASILINGRSYLRKLFRS